MADEQNHNAPPGAGAAPEAGAALTAGALAAAIAHHQEGRLDAARDGYQGILAHDPDNADALHLMGVVALQQGDAAAAADLIARAVALVPGNPGFSNNLGEATRALGRPADAIGHYRRALSLDPGYTDAAYNLGMTAMALEDLDLAIEALDRVVALRPEQTEALEPLGIALVGKGDLEKAIDVLERAVAANPGSLPAYRNLADAHATREEFAAAARYYEKALALDPGAVEVRFELGNALMQLAKPAAAEGHFRTVVAALPRFAAARCNLGHALRDTDRLDEAVTSYSAAQRIRRSWPAQPMEPGTLMARHDGGPSFDLVARHKLRHDIEQMRYLRGRDLLPAAFDDEIKAYVDVLGELDADASGERVFEMSAEDRARIGGTYNRIFHIAETPAGAESPIRPGFDTAAIEDAYHASDPGFTWIDGMLTDDALERLRRFCLESTIWHDFFHLGGYLGAYIDDGFHCGLLLQIADALRDSLPNVIGDHRLRNLWAYKYDSHLTGIPMHADEAAVNVNFWITPDDANLDPETGGLTVYPREAPLEWDFKKYNNNQEAMNAFVAGTEAINVPYRQNRALIFNSDCFHRTGDLHFKEGYENRRINITLLYGWRDGCSPTG